MSLLIRGMEMPQSCDDCEFCKRDISGYDWCCVPMMNGRDKPLDEPVMKPDWCPLVPVPPHGRLIDADALMKHKGDCYDANGHLLYAIGTGNIMCAPTIIPAEEGE